MYVGNALCELIAIDWKYRFGGWTEFMRLKVKIDVSKPLRRVVKLVDKEGVETIGVMKYELRSGGKSGGLALLWMEGVKVVVQNYSNYHIDSLITLDESVVVTPLT
ncbi:hypothetical protein Golax_005308 [Gossypium laxum]|uniref:Uncharacterized protein n=1 Tax=Gossypium laxum TaxID=34288 RepID=A0A7J9A1P0_9ROSI|nr:hypothetical protein [Gossypium laxum]